VDTEGYRCLLEGPYHLEGDCPVGRLIPADLRVADQGGVEVCGTCIVRREARARLDSFHERAKAMRPFPNSVVTAHRPE
jgi:hypothetical protein